jgi:hypothetical protein
MAASPRIGGKLGFGTVDSELLIGCRLRERVSGFGPEVRLLLRTIMGLPREERVRMIGELYTDEKTRSFAELLIDLETFAGAHVIVSAELRSQHRWGSA